MIRKLLSVAVTSFGFVLAFSGMAFAQEAGEAAVASASWLEASVLQFLAIGGGIALGMAALGCGLGQGKTVSSAMEGISRNPQAAGPMFVPMLLGLAFMEALVIFTLVFSFVFVAAMGTI